MDDYEKMMFLQIVNLVGELYGYINRAREESCKTPINDSKCIKIRLSIKQHHKEKEITRPNIEKLIKQEEITAFLKFTEKEILKMPKKFRKEFRVDGCTARITKRKSGKDGHCYEIRYRRNGYSVSASSTNLQEAKNKFIIALQTAIKVTEKQEYKAPTAFYNFAMYFFENYHVKKVAKTTYNQHLRIFKQYIMSSFDKIKIKDITPMQCQKVFDEVLNLGYGRTCEEIRSILNQIFEMANAHGLIQRNPLKVLLYEKHERETGTPISKDDEKKLLNALNNTEYLLPIAILLYTGVRPNELYTTRHEGHFIIANNSKRKSKKKESKKIAISPMLYPYLVRAFNSDEFPKSHLLRNELQKTLPKHTLKDCRMTFSTRSQECGVNETVVKIFMGHSLLDVLGRHYTSFSDEYLIAEAQKIKY